MMNNFIKTLEIKNFKSIKHLQLNCKRINVFIGKPNVGKSNILEGLSILGGTYGHRDRIFENLIRYDNLVDLFFDKNPLEAIEINSDKVCAFVRFHNNNIGLFDYMIGNESIKQFLNLSKDYNLGKLNDEFDTYLTNNSSFINNDHISPQYFQLDSTVGKILSNRGVSLPVSIFKKYSFRLNKINNAPFSAFLTVPYGENLFTIFSQNKELRKKIISELKKYDLSLINIQEKKEYVVQKTVDGDGIQFAYSTIADTFQRLYFHLAAIESNKNSTLIFEEPEAHAFPPYIVHFTQAVINSTTNQFFMATHSPFVLDDLMENARHELAVFVVDWKNGETVVHALTDEQLEEVYQYGVDLFTNIEAFS